MKHLIASFLLTSLALALTGCPERTPPVDAAVGDAPGPVSCGTVEGLDQPPEFVGSCTTPPDSEGNQACSEYTTKPNAVIIGTPCVRYSTCDQYGYTWADGARCPASFTRCSGDFGDVTALSWTLFESDPRGCAAP